MCDLDLDPMILSRLDAQLNLDIVVTYLHTKNEVNRLKGLKVMVWTNTWTDTQTDTQTYMCKTFTYPLPLTVMMANDLIEIMIYW